MWSLEDCNTLILTVVLIQLFDGLQTKLLKDMSNMQNLEMGGRKKIQIPISLL